MHVWQNTESLADAVDHVGGGMAFANDLPGEASSNVATGGSVISPFCDVLETINAGERITFYLVQVVYSLTVGALPLANATILPAR